MLAADIIIALKKKHNGHKWRNFTEFRETTGYLGKGANIIDFLAFGVYNSAGADKVVAYEIKQVKSDFRKDVNDFKTKQRIALEISNEFYYICPHGIISMDEVPEIAGLAYVTATKRIKIIKQAQYRELQGIPYYVVKNLLLQAVEQEHLSDIPIKYIGQELTQKDFMELVKKEAAKTNEYRIESEAEKIHEKLVKERDEAAGMLHDIHREAKCTWHYGNSHLTPKEKHEKSVATMKHANSITEAIEEISKKALEILDASKSLTELSKKP